MTVDRELEFWEGKAAHSEAVAIEAIGPDPSMWDGPQLESDLARILRVLSRPHFPGYILDLGCGIGRVAIPLAVRLSGLRLCVVGIDISESMLHLAESRARQLEKQIGTIEVYFVRCDGRNIMEGLDHEFGLNPGFTRKFALVYSILTLQHIPRDAAADYIKQVGQLLDSGGAFLFQTLEGTAGDFLWNEMTEDFARESCTAAGLEVVDIERVKVNTTDEATSIWVTAVKRT